MRNLRLKIPIVVLLLSIGLMFAVPSMTYGQHWTAYTTSQTTYVNHPMWNFPVVMPTNIQAIPFQYRAGLFGLQKRTAVAWVPISQPHCDPRPQMGGQPIPVLIVNPQDFHPPTPDDPDAEAVRRLMQMQFLHQLSEKAREEGITVEEIREQLRLLIETLRSQTPPGGPAIQPTRWR